ncbi:hypothetical protein CDV36_009010 [Fusarium kuroshium]|uniref:Uncharacterized protein n=1 Tax=Fusarium kuroshium TaxID=2010991 RepID=A0A3M2S1J2_9HYPO|nr:hypothetical protein CDV36_009010 [Fusarium kuroshium]
MDKEDPFMDSIDQWIKSSSPFGHVTFHESWNLTLRAAKIVNSFNPPKRIIYAVPSKRERDLLALHFEKEYMGVTAGFNNNGDICVLTHSEMYQQAKSATAGLHIFENFLVICEADVHYSLEYILGMICFMDIARSGTYGTRVLTLSADGFDLNLAKSMKLFGLTMSDTDHFSLPPEKGGVPLEYVDGEITSPYCIGRMRETVSRGDCVIVFCLPRERSEIEKSLEGTEGHAAPIDQNIMDLVQLGDKLESTVFFVTDHYSFPMDVKVSLIVVSHLREVYHSEHRTNHIVRKIVKRSHAELRDIMSHAYQNDERVYILSNASPGDLIPDMPQRRLENDQNLAFLFEILQICQDIKLGDLLTCFLTDLNAAFALYPQLLQGDWIRENTGPTTRGYEVVNSERAQMLTSLLPLFDYSFVPASFLSGFLKDSKPTIAVAIRIASICHKGFDFFSFDPAAFALQNDILVGEVVARIPSILEQTFSFPLDLVQHGILWIAIAAWHTWHMQRNEADVRNAIDVGAGSEFENLLLVDVTSASDIGILVNHLHKMLLGDAEHKGAITLTNTQCSRIQEELLGAWMYRTFLVKKDEHIPGDSPEVTDLVGLRVRGVEMSTPSLPLVELEQSVDPEENLYCVLVFEIDKLVDEELEDHWIVNHHAVVPLITIRRWQHLNAAKFTKVIQSKYSTS